MLTLSIVVAAQIASIPSVRHSASLTGEPAQIGTGILLAQAEAPPAPPPGVDAPVQPKQPRTLQELRDERARIDATRPSLGGPIALLAVGAGLCLVGLGVGIGGLELLFFYFFTGLGASYYGALGTVLTIVGFVLLGVAVVAIAVGIPLAVIGGVRLKRTINERTEIGKSMNEIDDQIRALEENAPPPAPPPPSSVQRNAGPQPLAVLGTF
jgi:hypothetical protein